MTEEQGQQLLALAQSQYTASLDATSTAHSALAYTQYTATVAEVCCLVVLVGFLIVCSLLRPTENLS